MGSGSPPRAHSGSSDPVNPERADRGGKGRDESAEASERPAPKSPRRKQIGPRRRGEQSTRDAKEETAAKEKLAKEQTPRGFAHARKSPVRRKPKGGPRRERKEPEPEEARSNWRKSRSPEECWSSSESGLGEGEEGWASDASRSLHQSEEEGGFAGLSTRMERDWEEVSEFATLVWKTDVRGKSFSQLAVLLVQFIGHCPGMLGKLAGDILFDAASTQGTAAGEPGWRDVLPLPVPDEVCETVSEILKSDDYKVKKKGLSGGAVKAAYRSFSV